jgi:hypothetical protein
LGGLALLNISNLNSVPRLDLTIQELDKNAKNGFYDFLKYSIGSKMCLVTLIAEKAAAAENFVL